MHESLQEPHYHAGNAGFGRTCLHTATTICNTNSGPAVRNAAGSDHAVLDTLERENGRIRYGHAFWHCTVCVREAALACRDGRSGVQRDRSALDA